MLAGKRIDPLARRAVLAISAGRIGIGAGALLATGPAVRALGFPAADSTGRALARLTGARDIALGALAIAARDDPAALRAVTAASAAVDAADALSLGLATADPEARAAGFTGLASGAAAALVGAWAWRRLEHGR